MSALSALVSAVSAPLCGDFPSKDGTHFLRFLSLTAAASTGLDQAEVRRGVRGNSRRAMQWQSTAEGNGAAERPIQERSISRKVAKIAAKTAKKTCQKNKILQVFRNAILAPSPQAETGGRPSLVALWQLSRLKSSQNIGDSQVRKGGSPPLRFFQ